MMYRSFAEFRGNQHISDVHDEPISHCDGCVSQTTGMPVCGSGSKIRSKKLEKPSFRQEAADGAKNPCSDHWLGLLKRARKKGPQK